MKIELDTQSEHAMDMWLDWAEANGISERMRGIVRKHWRVLIDPSSPFTLRELVNLDLSLTARLARRDAPQP